MNWIIIIGISIIISIIGGTIFRFFLDSYLDNKNLRKQTQFFIEKFKVIIDMLNQSAFNGRGGVDPIDINSFRLYEGYQNQIIHFTFNAGHLTIIWKYKYFQNEVVHEKTFRIANDLRLCDQQKIADEMINEMAVVVEKHKRNVLGAHSMEGMVDFNKGVAKYNRQDYLGAIADYTKAIELDPTETMATLTYYSRGITKSKLLDYSGAITDYSKTIELDPADTNAYFFRGEAKYDLNDYDGAIKDFSKTIEIGHCLPDAYFYRGLSKIKLGQKDTGCLELNKAVELGYADAYEAIRKYCN